jgi:hypothetical protein
MRGKRRAARWRAARPARRHWWLVPALLLLVAAGCLVTLSMPAGRLANGTTSRAGLPRLGTSPAQASQAASSATPHRRGGHRARRHGQTPVAHPSSSSSSVGGKLRGCSADPHQCGYPDATDTGAANSVTLSKVPGQLARGPGWVWQTDHIDVTGSGLTLANLDVAGYIDVYGSNVTIRNVRITATGQIWGIGICHARNLVIENSTISSPAASGAVRLEVGIKDVYGDAVGTTVRQTDISHASTAIQLSNGVIEGNYIHNFGYSSGDHLNGISVGGGDARPLLIKDNTVLDNYDQTDAVALFQDFGTEANKTVTGNLLGGGSYVIYGGGPGEGCTHYTGSSGCYGPSTNIVITDNRFSQRYFRAGGTFGYLSAFNPHGSGNVFTGNVWDSSGATMRIP